MRTVSLSDRRGDIFWPLVLAACLAIAAFGIYARLYSAPAAARQLGESQQQLFARELELRALEQRIASEPARLSDSSFLALAGGYAKQRKALERNSRAPDRSRLKQLHALQLQLTQNGKLRVELLRVIWQEAVSGSGANQGYRDKIDKLDSEGAEIWAELFAAAKRSGDPALQRTAAAQSARLPAPAPPPAAQAADAAAAKHG